MCVDMLHMDASALRSEVTSGLTGSLSPVFGVGNQIPCKRMCVLHHWTITLDPLVLKFSSNFQSICDFTGLHWYILLGNSKENLYTCVYLLPYLKLVRVIVSIELIILRSSSLLSLSDVLLSERLANVYPTHVNNKTSMLNKHLNLWHSNFHVLK